MNDSKRRDITSRIRRIAERARAGRTVTQPQETEEQDFCLPVTCQPMADIDAMVRR